MKMSFVWRQEFSKIFFILISRSTEKINTIVFAHVEKVQNLVEKKGWVNKKAVRRNASFS
jgi:hypothetical protein